MNKYRHLETGFEVGKGIAFTVGGFQYPSNWFDLATPEEISAAGFDVFEVDDVALVVPERIVLSNEQLRALAYQTESDPLFFQEQRGEIPAGSWLAKVAEIKERFPNDAA